MPDNWLELFVSDIAASSKNAIVGGPFGSDLVSLDYVPFGVPVIRGQNMAHGREIGGEYVFVSDEKAKRLSANLAQSGDLIFTQRGTLGQVALVPLEDKNKYLISQSQMKLTPDRSKADVLFLYYLFCSPSQQRYIRNNAIQTGVPHTNLGILKNTPLLLPPLNEQCDIASVLGALDDKIELNRRMNRTLEAIAQALFKSWFVDFDPVRAKLEGRKPDGMDAETAALFPSEFRESETGPIPKGWKYRSLGEVAQNMRVQSLPRDFSAETPYIGLEHMPRKSIALDQWGFADKIVSNKYAFFKGQILFGKLRPYFHKVGIAPLDGVCSTDIVVIAPLDGAYRSLVLGHVSSDAFVDYCDTGEGSKMPRTDWGRMASYPIAIPPIELAAAATALTKPLLDKIIANIHESRLLAQMRDALLPKLISGEIRVPDAEREVETIHA